MGRFLPSPPWFSSFLPATGGTTPFSCTLYDFSSYLSSKYGEAYLDMGILFLEIWGRDIFIWNAYLDTGVPEMSKSSRHSISGYF
jgi:hypothetical protein